MFYVDLWEYDEPTEEDINGKNPKLVISDFDNGQKQDDIDWDHVNMYDEGEYTDQADGYDQKRTRSPKTFRLICRKKCKVDEDGQVKDHFEPSCSLLDIPGIQDALPQPPPRYKRRSDVKPEIFVTDESDQLDDKTHKQEEKSRLEGSNATNIT